MSRIGQPTFQGRVPPARSAGVALLVSLAALAAAFQSQPARGDTLVLKDGTTYEGRTIERTADYVVLQVNSGGISASMRFEARDIVSLTESAPESAQLAEQFRQKWAAAEEAATAAAFADLGQWAQENQLNEKAASAYDKARKAAPDQDAVFGMAMAQNLALANDFRGARAVLKELADKYKEKAPANVAAELARIDQQAQKRVDQVARVALDNYKKGDMRTAVQLMERLQRLDLDDVNAKADVAMNHLAGMAFGPLLADARLHEPCPTCGVESQLGLVPCPTCKGAGKLARTRIETVTEKDPKTSAERKRVYQVDYSIPCPNCHGFTTVICPTCRGAGLDLGTIGAAERPFVIDGLKKRIDFLYDKIAPYAKEPSSLHPVNLEIVHLHGLRLRYFMQQFVLLNPDVVGGNLTTLADRRTSLDNLLRTTTAAYRNRDLDEYKDAIAARLKELIRRDGILWPEDLDFKEHPEVSTGSSRPAGKP